MRAKVFRGEHGKPRLESKFQTRLGSLTFTPDIEAAKLYATHPNNRLDAVVSPRVIVAEVEINSPLVEDQDDPFLELSRLAYAVAEEETREIALKHRSVVEETDLWNSEFSQKFGSLENLILTTPERLLDIYVQAWPLFDDPEIVVLLRKEGYDGAITGGCGATFGSPEYRIFDSKQASIIEVRSVV